MIVALSIGPPVIKDQGTNGGRLLEELTAATPQSPIHMADSGKGTIGHALVEQRPQPFRRLQLGCIRGEHSQVQPEGQAEPGCPVPRGAIKDQHDMCMGTKVLGVGEVVRASCIAVVLTSGKMSQWVRPSSGCTRPYT
jgi:hypothetical protein